MCRYLITEEYDEWDDTSEPPGSETVAARHLRARIGMVGLHLGGLVYEAHAAALSFGIDLDAVLDELLAARSERRPPDVERVVFAHLST